MRVVRRPAYLAAVLSVVACLGTGGMPAHATGPVTDGFLCGSRTLVDPNPQDGTLLLEVGGGPVLLTEADGVTPARGTLFCHVVMRQEHYYFGTGHTEPGMDVAGRGTGVLATARTTLRVPEDYWGVVTVCTQFVDDRTGVTYYWEWTFGDAAEPQDWSTDPDVWCALRSASFVPPLDGETGLLVDAILCPILAIVFPPEGDVVLPVAQRVWDCPPYGPPGPGAGLPSTGLVGCDDGLDDDGDGLVDYPADPGCAGPSDPDEHSFAACDDGADGDGDRATDYPRDPGCASPEDTDERGTTACDDGLDNDADGSRDYLLDDGCASPGDENETDDSLLPG